MSHLKQEKVSKIKGGRSGIMSTDPNTGLPLLIISIFFLLRGVKPPKLEFHSLAERKQTEGA